MLSLDREEDWQRLRAGPSFAGIGPGTIVVDEWQTHPESWTYARHRIDAGAEPGRFLLAGSSTPKPEAALHSGAGRLIALKMRPMAIFERVVGRDLPEQGFSVRNRESLLACLRAYATASSTDASYTAILSAATPGDAEKPARSTTRAYRDLLVEQ